MIDYMHCESLSCSRLKLPSTKAAVNPVKPSWWPSQGPPEGFTRQWERLQLDGNLLAKEHDTTSGKRKFKLLTAYE